MNTSNYTFVKTKPGFKNSPSYFGHARFVLTKTGEQTQQLKLHSGKNGIS